MQVGWQPLRVGTLAGSMLPFISLGPTSDPATTCLFWGVTFWQSEKLFAAV